MGDWICDANINEATVDKLNKVSGIKAEHIVRDYGITDSREDDEIIALAKKEHKTLITADYRDFNVKANTIYVNCDGIWILKTSDPDKQVDLIKKLRIKGNLKTLASRKNKKVFIRSDEIAEITDVKTQKKILLDLKSNKKKK